MRSVTTLWLALCLLAPLGLRAAAPSTGLALELILDDAQFLPGEEIPVGARISNLTGRPITFGTSSNWLTFLVETKRGEIVNRLGPVPVQGEFTLESAKAGTKWWNIQPWFDLEHSGLYLVSAELRIPDWNERILSDPVPFTIQSSAKLWEITFGVPPANGETNRPPELRRYALQAATRGKERVLFSRVSDASDSRIYKVVALDHLLSFSNPRQQIDSQSRLHVLFQTGGNIYTYCIVNWDGEVVIRQRHDIIPGSRPQLAKRADGSIEVVGGKRVPTYADVPPYEPPAPSLDKTNAPVTVTNAPPADPKKAARDAKKKKRDGNGV